MPIKNITSNVPVFTSENEYCSHRSNLDFWWPNIVQVLERHNLANTIKRSTAECGFNSTYPVFLIDDIVVKFFGHRPYWQNAFHTECAAHEYLLQDNTILAPRILAKGQLFENPDSPWPYIISSKISGKSWLDRNLTDEEKNNVATEIGHQLRKIHALPTDNRLKHDHEWSKLNFRNAVEKSVLPKHLIAQVDSFIAKLDDFDRCFVNGDMVDMHVFVDNGGVCQQRCRLKVEFFILPMHIHTDAPHPRLVLCHRPCHPGIPAQTDLLPYIAHLICLSHVNWTLAIFE